MISKPPFFELSDQELVNEVNATKLRLNSLLRQAYSRRHQFLHIVDLTESTIERHTMAGGLPATHYEINIRFYQPMQPLQSLQPE